MFNEEFENSELKIGQKVALAFLRRGEHTVVEIEGFSQHGEYDTDIFYFNFDGREHWAYTNTILYTI